MKRKEVDDVLGGDEMWKHADSTDSKPYFPKRFSDLTMLRCLL